MSAKTRIGARPANAVLLIYLNASPQSAALRGERNHLREFGIFVGGGATMDARKFTN
jgi:hypothetical protein